MRFIATMAATVLIAGLSAQFPVRAAELGCDPDSIDPATACADMSVEQAGQVYLEFMCPANKARIAFWAAVRRYDRRDRDGDRPHANTRKAARKAGRVLSELSDQFAGGYTWAGYWPSSVADNVEAIAQGAFADAGQFHEIAARDYRWGEMQFVDITTEADRVRYALGLPPRNSDPGC